MESLLQPNKRVLSTLNDDGSRRWLKPRPSRGPFWRRRRAVAYGLITLFVGLPYLRINDKPAVLLDIVHREFTLFGRTFLPTDTVLLALLIVGIFVSVFFATAVLGRVWCGWGCPQTVYLEFVFRPIERLLQGEPGSPRKPPQWVGMLKFPVYLLLSAFLAHTFLAYFVGIEALLGWVQRSPLSHPVPFLVMAITTGLMMFDFSFFREQMCIIACPYGRMQSVMLDRGSLIVGYDKARGEPRGKAKRTDVSLKVVGDGAEKQTGDCVDCLRCVTTCPTGIDIREGLQMECIACTQCIDACDDVMTKLKRPTGLIRYASQRSMEGATKSWFRPRIFVYSFILLVITVTLTTLLMTASPVDVRLLRGRGQPFSISEHGAVVGTLQLKLTNRTERAAVYTVKVVQPAGGDVHFDENPMTVPAGQMHTQGGTLILPRDAFGSMGTCPVQVEISDGSGYVKRVSYTALGPAGHEHHDEKPDGHSDKDRKSDKEEHR